VAKNDKNSYVRTAAVRNLSDQTLVSEISQNDKDIGVRLRAIVRLAELKGLCPRSYGGIYSY
jgi:hypothetical protein